MYPFIEIFGTEISSYAVMAIVGLLIAGFIFCKIITEKLPDDK